MTKSFALPLALPLAVLLSVAPPANARPSRPDAHAAVKPAVDPTLFKGMKWREIGPFRGGRVAAVTGVRGDRNTYYFGGTGGGVWKSTDAGRSWKNVSDGFFGGSVGAVAVSDWDPNVVYAGGGGGTVGGNGSPRGGPWESTAAGKT